MTSEGSAVILLNDRNVTRKNFRMMDSVRQRKFVSREDLHHYDRSTYSARLAVPNVFAARIWAWAPAAQKFMRGALALGVAAPSDVKLIINMWKVGKFLSKPACLHLYISDNLHACIRNIRVRRTYGESARCREVYLCHWVLHHRNFNCKHLRMGEIWISYFCYQELVPRKFVPLKICEIWELRTSICSTDGRDWKSSPRITSIMTITSNYEIQMRYFCWRTFEHESLHQSMHSNLNISDSEAELKAA